VFKPGEMPNDGDLVDMLLDFAPDPVQQKKILVDNPSRIFGFK
jgi:predicted TIM-barrel fold metal-dependent hydrolase